MRVYVSPFGTLVRRPYNGGVLNSEGRNREVPLYSRVALISLCTRCVRLLFDVRLLFGRLGSGFDDKVLQWNLLP